MGVVTARWTAGGRGSPPRLCAALDREHCERSDIVLERKCVTLRLVKLSHQRAGLPRWPPSPNFRRTR